MAARTKQEILEALKASFVGNAVLQSVYGITGTSPFDQEFSLASLEAALLEVQATESKTIEDLIALHERIVTNLLESMTPGHRKWYQSRCLEFQAGHSFVWDSATNKYRYMTDDAASRIVKLASVTEVSSSLVIKVAKLDTAGDPIPLTALELDAFSAYVEQFKYAGVQIQKISRVPDKMRLRLRVYYNPMVLADNGSLLSNASVFPVADAVKEFLKLIPFNGMFNVTDLIDKLQNTTGVVNPLYLEGSAQYGTQPFVPVIDYYQPNAGYIVMDDAVPLDVEYITAP